MKWLMFVLVVGGGGDVKLSTAPEKKLLHDI